MRRIVSQHLGLWVLAGALFVGLGVASAMPDPKNAEAVSKERVFVPRGAQTVVQDPKGVHWGCRSSLAAGAL